MCVFIPIVEHEDEGQVDKETDDKETKNNEEEDDEEGVHEKFERNLIEPNRKMGSNY